jgi:hypothetical protein
MSEDTDTNFELAEIGAELTKDDTGTNEPVDEEKLRKAKLVDELNAEISSVRELPKREKPSAQIPETAELGKKFTVKLGKRYDVVQLQIYQGEKIEEVSGNDNCVHDKTEKRKDEISYEFFDPVPLKGKTLNGLIAGKYLIVVHAYGQESGDELEQEKVITVS